MFLLDTNVISELRKAKPHGAVLEWFRSVPERNLSVPCAVIGEIQSGAEITKRQDAAKAAQIESWLGNIMATFRVIPMDGIIFREWALLMDRRSDALIFDAMIAATARVHQWTVATRNVKDFDLFHVKTFNPFKFGPGATA